MDAGRGSNIFPMPQIPELLFPPPPPPLSSSYSLSASTSRHAPTITSFPILVLTVLGILTTSVLLLAYYVFVIRCCLRWHRGSSTSSDAAGHRRRQRATSSSSTTTSSLPASGAAPTEACGLDDAVIQALPAFRYRKAVKNAAAADSAAAAPTSECAVCLGEFEDEERVRMLPACLHVFHAHCIDTWLQGNANCPLCRAAITGHCLLPPLDLDRPRRPEPGEVVIQVVPTTGTEEDEQTMRAQQQEQASMAMAPYESAGDTNTADQQVSSDKRKSSNDWRDIDISSKADECVVDSKDRDVLPLRRSFSRGEMAGGEVHLQIQSILQRNTHFHGDDGDSCSNSSSA